MKPSFGKSNKPHSGAFFTLVILAALAAGVSGYIQFRIRTTAASIAWLQAQRKMLAQVTRSGVAASAPSHSPVGSASVLPDSSNWRWIPDGRQVEQEARQVASALGADLGWTKAAKDRLGLRLRFNQLYEMLGLSDSEIAAFESVAIDEKLSFTELLTPDPARAEDYKNRQAALLDRVVQETLGPAYVEPFRAYLLTSDLRAMTSELAVYSQGAGESIDPGQAERLLQIYLNHRQSSTNVARIAVNQIDWDLAASSAKEILTPTQQRLLELIIQRQKFDRMFQDITGLSVHRPIRGLRP